MKNDCIFCAIAAGEIPSKKVYEDEDVYAFLDINPASEGHTLVIPKLHFEGLLDTDEKTLFSLISKVKKIAAMQKAAYNADGFNILQNNGEASGQTVKHIHFHIIPRYTGKKLDFLP